jgi:hypothetical protein
VGVSTVKVNFGFYAAAEPRSLIEVLYSKFCKFTAL